MESSGETLMAYHQWQLLRGTDIKASGRQREKKKEQKKLCVGEPGDFSSFLLILRLILSHFGSF
jgi:hypothetical protein